MRHWRLSLRQRIRLTSSRLRSMIPRPSLYLAARISWKRCKMRKARWRTRLVSSRKLESRTRNKWLSRSSTWKSLRTGSTSRIRRDSNFWDRCGTSPKKLKLSKSTFLTSSRRLHFMCQSRMILWIAGSQTMSIIIPTETSLRSCLCESRRGFTSLVPSASR